MRAIADSRQRDHVSLLIRSASNYSDRLFEPLLLRSSLRFSSSLDVPAYFIHLVFLVEDKRFAIHPGVDPISIIRALIKNLLNTQQLQGASTLTQQLYDVKKAAASSSYARPRSIKRKIRQATWSIQHEIQSNKGAILQSYLDQVYWGRNYFGIDAAVRGYFRSTRSALSISEAFFLAERLANPNDISESRIVDLLRRPAVSQIVQTPELLREVWNIYRRWEAGTLR